MNTSETVNAVMYGLFVTVGLLLCLICTSLSYEQVAQSVASGTCRPSWALRMSKSQLLNWERRLGSMAAPYSYVETQESGAEGQLQTCPRCPFASTEALLRRLPLHEHLHV